jgi:carbonic anhydrase/acetyltransferase-like protein (isoleucine patch superfamily)
MRRITEADVRHDVHSNGAGALVTEGKRFPDNSLIVGASARAIRTLDEKAHAMIAAGADIYVRRWQRYAKELMRIG